MINEEGLAQLRASLEADGYRVEVDDRGERVGVSIVATADACPECLVPKPLMLSFLEDALGVSEQSIDLSYPEENGQGAFESP